MGMAMCCTAQRKDETSRGPQIEIKKPIQLQKGQLPVSDMDQATIAPAADAETLNPSQLQSSPAAPVITPVIKPLDFSVTAARFKTESHGPFYTEHYANFKPDDDQELFYEEKRQMPDGIYSGYMKKDSRLGQIRHGPGTLVQQEGLWRMEGLWAYNNAFVFVGVKEHNDGEIYEGHFSKNEYEGKGVLDDKNGKRLAGNWKGGRYLGRASIQEVSESDSQHPESSSQSLSDEEVYGASSAGAQSRERQSVAQIAQSLRKHGSEAPTIDKQRLHRATLPERAATKPGPASAPLPTEDPIKANVRRQVKFEISEGGEKSIKEYLYPKKLLKRQGPISYPRDGDSPYDSDKEDNALENDAGPNLELEG